MRAGPSGSSMSHADSSAEADVPARVTLNNSQGGFSSREAELSCCNSSFHDSPGRGGLQLAAIVTTGIAENIFPITQ